MKKAGWYVLLVVLGAIGLLSALRAIELLFMGGLSAYGAGQVAGSTLMAVIFLLLAFKVLKRARAS